MQASATPSAISAAIALCHSMRGSRGAVSAEDLASLVTACTLALSSLEVAGWFSFAVSSVCAKEAWMNSSGIANRVSCHAVGVIPALVAALSTHGTASPRVAARGCVALANLSLGNTANADAIVLSTRGLDVILSMMTAHVEQDEPDGNVQKMACQALCWVARAASPAAKRAMRDSSAMELVEAARTYHVHTIDGLKRAADEALAALELDA